MGHAPKLEPPADDASADASASRLRDSIDLLVSDFAARQVFDEQALSDIPESGSHDDDPDNMDDTEKTMDEYLSRLVQETETINSDTLRATSRIKIHPFDKTSWTQRVLSWFMSRFGQSDLR
jgi:hypothetical protein